MIDKVALESIEQVLGRRLLEREQNSVNCCEALSDEERSELNKLRSISSTLPLAYLHYKLERFSLTEAVKFVNKL
ncbi:hypothetical protein [Microbulbifer sp. PAAF003]|uniref:hypothetical protein n=1 Tax=Microbulbifer sp. PAAF003 TaxID=3243375 RepID=UPI0040393622